MKRTLLAVAALAGILALALAPPLRGAGERIEDIRLEGNEFITEDAFLALLRIKKGDPYDRTVLRQEFRRVWDSHLFNNLRLEEEDGPSGKILIFVVEEKPRVQSVTYDKVEALSVSKLEEALDQNNLRISPGSPLDENRISQNKKLIEEMLAADGFADARVDVVRREITPTRVEIHFTIDPGFKTKIRKIAFTGNTVFTAGQLKKFMKKTAEHWWGSFMTSRDVYYPGKFREDADRITQEYMKRGYLDINVQDPVLREVESKPKDQKRFVELLVPLQEGSRYHIGMVTIEGNTVFPTSELQPLVPIRSGDIANDTLVKLGRVRIEEKYGNEGYIFVAAPHRYEKSPDRVADLRYVITEDQKYFVRRIEFEGNVKTKDEVLRREMLIQEDDVFRREEFQISLRKIGQLGYFKLHQDTPTIDKVPDEPGKVDVTIRGEEVGRNEIQFGGGYSGLDGLFATFSFQSRNFLGRGESFSVSAQVGGSSDRYMVSFIEPYVARSRWTVGTSFFKTSLDYPDYTREGTGLSLFGSHPIGNFSNVTTTYRYESDKTDLDTFGGIVPVEDQTGSITPAYSFNTVNNPYRPTAGLRFLGSVELASNLLGGDAAFYRPIGEVSWYFGGNKGILPGTKLRPYFAVHGEVGYVAQLQTDDDIPLFERFYLGGERSLRGFETRSISPKVVNTVTNEELAVGGNQYYEMNFEYAYPLSDFFEFAAFLDAGNTWGVKGLDPLRYVTLDPDGDTLPNYTPGDFTVSDNSAWGDIRYSTGIEARFYTPMFVLPLRLIFAYNLSPRPGEDRTEFLFSIGRTFQ